MKETFEERKARLGREIKKGTWEAKPEYLANHGTLSHVLWQVRNLEHWVTAETQYGSISQGIWKPSDRYLEILERFAINLAEDVTALRGQCSASKEPLKVSWFDRALAWVMGDNKTIEGKYKQA